MSKNFLNELSERIGRDRKSTRALLDGLRSALIQRCGELEAIAVPGFGTFTPAKHPEKVTRDLASGNDVLLPPEITLEFTPASKLRKIAERNADI